MVICYGSPRKLICHARQYYIAIKKNEVLTDAITWMNFENIILNERGPIQKRAYCVKILYIENINLFKNLQKNIHEYIVYIFLC